MIDEPDETYFDTQLAGTRRRITKYEAARRTRSRWMLIVGSTVAGLSLTGGAVAVIQASTTEKTVSFCYSNASIDSDRTGISTPPHDGIVKPETQMQQRVHDAEEQCGAVWSIGTFSPEGPSDDVQYPVPDLFTCVLADGRLGVFPVEPGITCKVLELREP